MPTDPRLLENLRFLRSKSDGPGVSRVPHPTMDRTIATLVQHDALCAVVASCVRDLNNRNDTISGVKRRLEKALADG